MKLFNTITAICIKGAGLAFLLIGIFYAFLAYPRATCRDVKKYAYLEYISLSNRLYRKLFPGTDCEI